MADQFERLAADIIAAINRINTSVQKLSTYISANTYSLGDGYVTEIAGIAALISGISIATELIGNMTTSSSLSGTMFVQQLTGLVAAIGAATADLENSLELISSAVESSGVSGSIMGIGWPILIAGSSVSASLGSSSMPVEKTLIGSSIGTTTGVAAKLWS